MTNVNVDNGGWRCTQCAATFWPLGGPQRLQALVVLHLATEHPEKVVDMGQEPEAISREAREILAIEPN